MVERRGLRILQPKGDPAAVMLGPDATPEAIQRLRTQLGLDRSLLVQFVTWMGQLVRADLGQSIFFQQPVTAVIADHLTPTVLLSLLALFIAVGIGVPAGIISAVDRGGIKDQATMTIALVGVSIPEFWLSLNLVLLLAVRYQWFPVAGYVPLTENPWLTLKHLLLPAFSMGFVQSALIARMSRTAALDVLGQGFIRTARAKGLSEWIVINRHMLRNALVTIITVIGIVFSILMGGNVAVESIFGIPGIGQLLITSVLRRDYPVIQGIVLLIATTYVFINLIVDLLYALVDPRIQYQ